MRSYARPARRTRAPTRGGHHARPRRSFQVHDGRAVARPRSTPMNHPLKAASAARAVVLPAPCDVQANPTLGHAVQPIAPTTRARKRGTRRVGWMAISTWTVAEEGGVRRSIPTVSRIEAEDGAFLVKGTSTVVRSPHPAVTARGNRCHGDPVDNHIPFASNPSGVAHV